MGKAPITKEGHKALTAELKNLLSKEKPEIIKAIASARELGDLSENADYHAARERHSFIEGRIAYLENRLASVEIIDISRFKGSTITFGATVEIEDLSTQEKMTYRIVGEDEADIKKQSISFSSPVARALIGKKAGDEVEVKTPKGFKEYAILDVLYK